MPVAELTDLLIPYWQKAEYEFDPWAIALARATSSLIGASLTRLKMR